jgi:hypothetical protein
MESQQGSLLRSSFYDESRRPAMGNTFPMPSVRRIGMNLGVRGTAGFRFHNVAFARRQKSNVTPSSAVRPGNR